MTMTYAKTEALAKPSPRKVTSVEQEIAIATLVLAFSNDPAVRWLFPDTHRYLIYFPHLSKLLQEKHLNKALPMSVATLGHCTVACTRSPAPC
jgi:hypothetical protein